MSDFRAVSQLAYELWEKGGRREGTAEQNWLEAERILAARARKPLSAQAVDTLLTTPGAPSAPARTRKTAARTTAKTGAKGSRKPAASEPPKVSSGDAPGG